MANASIEDLLGKNKKPTGPVDDSTQGKFNAKITAINLKKLEELAQKKAAELGVEYISLERFPISPEALSLIPVEQSAKEKVIGFLYTGSEVRLAAMDPKTPGVEEIKYQVAERTHANVTVYLISEQSYKAASKMYEALPKIVEAPKGVEISEADLAKFQTEITTLKELNQYIQKVSTTDFVALVIAMSLKAGSSDVHIEAEEKDVKVRYRIDGILHDVASVSADMWQRIISRIKLVSGLKINVTNVPQDGRFTIFLAGGEKVEVRVSTLPTAYGESVVFRLLKSSSVGLQFEQLGIRGKAYEQLKRQVERPNGMIITTGPTGSGKTTTLYAILNKLNDSETKIITLEDPVEYKLKGINQSQIEKSKDYTFAKGLNSILRQDPDVIMVGELRDLETAEVAIQAALTGHLVVSTIHTNSAAGAIPRFLSMGVKPFLLAPSLNAIIGQRLVRKIHEECKAEMEPTAEQLERVKGIIASIAPDSGYTVPDKLVFYKGKGCANCDDIGYKGRMGIYEILTMTPEIEKIILGGAVSEYDMQDIAVKQGMITMVQDGILKALDGITTLEEVFAAAE